MRRWLRRGGRTRRRGRTPARRAHPRSPLAAAAAEAARTVEAGVVAGLQVRLAQLEPIEVLRGLVLELVVELTEVAMVLPSWQPATSVGLRT